jgi:hypothetical protein
MNSNFVATLSIIVFDMSTTTFPTSEPVETAVFNEKFTLFRKLPAELRLIIWKFALPGPRVLKMNRHYTLNQQRALFPPIFPSNFLSGLGMLHTCLEARQVVLKAFSVLPSVRDQGPRGLNLARSLYFNPEVNTLYFVAPDSLRDCVVRRDYGNHARDRRVRRIAVAVRHTQGTSNIILAFILIWEPNYSS